MEVSGELLALAALSFGKNRGTHWIVGCVVHRAGLDDLERKWYYPSIRIRNPKLPGLSLASIPAELCKLPIQYSYTINKSNHMKAYRISC
jgi:hypothetical protein